MRKLKKSDYYGLGVSVLLHGLLVVLFAFMTIGAREEATFGYIEVELGPFSEGKPVQRTAEKTAQENEARPVPEQPRPEQNASPPEEAKPVDLPTQPEEVDDEERISTPKTETVSPETNNQPAEERQPNAQPERQPVQPLGGGTPDGTTGPAQGDQGTGEDEQKAAPFLIEGLNRRLVYGPPPSYSEKVNATIQYSITVDPRGRIVGMRPLLKGSAALEQSIQEALRRWRFNPLPSNAPSQNQTGRITFRFRLE